MRRHAERRGAEPCAHGGGKRLAASAPLSSRGGREHLERDLTPGRQLAAYHCERSRLAVSEGLSPERLPRVATLANVNAPSARRKRLRAW